MEPESDDEIVPIDNDETEKESNVVEHDDPSQGPPDQEHDDISEELKVLSEGIFSFWYIHWTPMNIPQHFLFENIGTNQSSSLCQYQSSKLI